MMILNAFLAVLKLDSELENSSFEVIHVCIAMIISKRVFPGKYLRNSLSPHNAKAMAIRRVNLARNQMRRFTTVSTKSSISDNA